MSLRATALVLLTGIFLLIGLGPVSGPARLPALTTGAALADDDDGGFSGRGFRGALRFGRIMMGLPRFSQRRYGKRRGYSRRSTPVEQTSTAREIVAIGLTPDDLEALTALGFATLGQRHISAFGTSLTRLQIPAKHSMRRALRIVSDMAPGATVSSNDLYGGLPRILYEPEGQGCGERCEAFELTSWTSEFGRCGTDVRIGVVDTAADLRHPSLSGAHVTQKSFRSPDRPASDTAHGTAVLSLLVGQPNSSVVGLLHGAHIFHAEAFHGTGEKISADVYDLVAAIDWLLAQDVRVLNLSFSGPDNVVLHRAIVAAQNNGVHLVAASGRPDRARTAGYPARYPGVIAVSAVDNLLRPSRQAQRGEHLAFVAPGVGLTVAHGTDGLRRVDGSSFATPFVAAAYAVGSRDSKNRTDITRLLVGSAQDLGAPGRDSTYGWGLVQYTAIPNC